jgi:hypothetical protein
VSESFDGLWRRPRRPITPTWPHRTEMSTAGGRQVGPSRQAQRIRQGRDDDDCNELGGTTPQSVAPTTTPFGARSSATMDSTTICKGATTTGTGVAAGHAVSSLVPRLTDAKGSSPTPKEQSRRNIARWKNEGVAGRCRAAQDNRDRLGEDYVEPNCSGITSADFVIGSSHDHDHHYHDHGCRQSKGYDDYCWSQRQLICCRWKRKPLPTCTARA